MVKLKFPSVVPRRLESIVKCLVALASSTVIFSGVRKDNGKAILAPHLTETSREIVKFGGGSIDELRRSRWQIFPWHERWGGCTDRVHGSASGRRGNSRSSGGGYVDTGQKRQRSIYAGLAVPATTLRARRHQCAASVHEEHATLYTRIQSAFIPPVKLWTPSYCAKRSTSARSRPRRSRVSNLGAMASVKPPDQKQSVITRREARHRARVSASQARARARAPKSRGPTAFMWSLWRGLRALEGWCEASWGGRACAHVVAGALASCHPFVASVVVGLALWVSCAKGLGDDVRGKDSWKQVARITAEVAVLWYCHALPHGLGVGRSLRGNFGSGKAGDLLGATWHFLGQGAFVRLVAASGRLVGVNVLEANGLLLGVSCLGNEVAGSRMRHIVGTPGTAQASTYQLRGFFSRTNGVFGDNLVLSLPFDVADTFLALQGILSATEREVVRKNGLLATAFREFAALSGNTLDAHSLGALGARNLMGMGFVRARVRMFGRPALSLGWTEKASNMCMVGDPICGSLLQKILDPTCVMLKGRGHFFDAYQACVGC